MENIMDLNQLLKERAEKKLRSDINAYLNQIRENQFFRQLKSVNICTKEDKRESLWTWTWENSGEAFEMIMEKCLPQYIEDESKAFIEKVESIRQDVDNLLSNTDY